MGVQEINAEFGKDGHGDAIADFKRGHEENSAGLLNVLEGKKARAPRPPYDPNHPDNKWPIMVHHASKGELTVGTNLKGVTLPSERERITAENEKALAEALAVGYRRQPFVKPQIAIADPATEKALLVKKIAELEGQNALLSERFQQLMDRLDADAKAAPPIPVKKAN